ncbi:hypothetical protein KDH_49760 [Dictyobacter sp. S3.2.2.5]|uniref:L,D-TPase catalytic domain-containing protein n=1 Tax=Dictyobacter halimunensis TaxID=3026934 RepID=A0ABQ6G0F1_9CHLR|nr:hypothetical protein KDH_49760 [Dictyobacter sp. S3.2.2.5]
MFRHSRLGRLVVVLVLSVSLLATGACAGDAQVRRQAMENEQRLSQLLHSARQLGFSTATLRPIQTQYVSLRSSQPPFSLFSNQPLNDYYLSLARRYLLLHTQLQDLIATASPHVHARLQQELQATRTMQVDDKKAGLPAWTFPNRLSQLQDALLHAQSFNDYEQVHTGLLQVAQEIHTLEMTSNHLSTLHNLLTLAQQAGLKTYVLTLQSAYQTDQQRFQQATGMASLPALNGLLDAHIQQATVVLTQAMPAVTSLRLRELTGGIQQLPASHVDPTAYQERLALYQKQAASAMDIPRFQRFLQQINGDIFAVKAEALREDTDQAIHQFHQDVDDWSSGHLYYDSYDGNSYAVDVSYLNSNFGLDADNLLNQATTLDDLQSALDTARTLFFNHQLMEMDYDDPTPYDQVHASDMQALHHYQLMQGQVIVISLCKQSLRLYQDGQLVRSFLVTTGRPERPSPPGVWTVLNRLSPTIFKSSDPPTSPLWYPKTVIQHAILFHDGGYFIHDSWWRANYGPDTEFPHYDDSGDEHSSGNGSHGCVNLPPDEAAWLYYNTGWNTSIVVY